MEDKDIVGKKFTCFEFKSIDTLVSYNKEYQECVGKSATVIQINDMHPQYAYAKINISVGKTKSLHYPVQMIIDQLQYENKSTEDLLNDMKQLMSRI